MSLLTWIGVYVILWWLILFTTLPFGVRSQEEVAEGRALGTEPGAPVRHLMLVKAGWTTLVATLIFAAIYVGVDRFGLTLNDIPLMPRFD